MKPRVTLAWAVVGKPSRLQDGKVLRDLFGQYGIYTTRKTSRGRLPELRRGAARADYGRAGGVMAATLEGTSK